ncbi:MAG: acetyl-CoA carboxylase biotin carboxyl carrier protein subunit [Candidatus Krumholzibacteriia bacterium]|nr:acetyl-CoA carboxylase biotin carboxyl carrier protein subunit [Candidatus Latescibacterota bacterium]
MSATRYVVRLGEQTHDVSIAPQGERWSITVDGVERLVEQTVVERDQVLSLIVGDHSYLVDLVETDWETGRFVVGAIGEQVELTVRDELEAAVDALAPTAAAHGLFELRAPMPGIVLRALAAPGERVTRGQGLLVLEAMKMQNELASELDGVVQEILVKDGQLVETNALLARVIRDGEDA